jgi:FkbM family methyltransferase
MGSHSYPYVVRKIRSIYRKWRSVSQNRVIKEEELWFKNNGELTHRIDYDLNEDSIVVDIGGYHGEWSHIINSTYHPQLLIFEPVKNYYKLINKYLGNKKNISIFNQGVSDKDHKAKININSQGSSVYFGGGVSEEDISLIDVKKIFEMVGKKDIDLIKIGVEGAEYEILERITSLGLTKRCKNIQVAFHKINKHSEQRRNAIRKELEKTHKLTYDYYFLCENWKRLTD